MPDNTAPSNLKLIIRAFIGAAQRWYDRDHAVSGVTVGGTGNAITLTYPIAPNAYVQGQRFTFKAGAANSGATTLTPNSGVLAAKNIFKRGASGVVACAGGEIETGDIVTIDYDGTQFQLVSQAANAGSFAGGTLTATTAMSGAALNDAFATIASATTTNIGAAAANYLQVTGTTAITAFDTVQAGTERTLEFAGILTLTHNATTLILPSAASITTAAGDVAIMRSEGSGNWRCVSYTKASGQAIRSASGGIQQVVSTETGAVNTGTTTMTYADTIPQNTEGDQYMSLAITPANASSTLIIDVVWNGANNTGNVQSIALFQDATAGALASVSLQAVTANTQLQLVLRHKMTSGTTSATTFKVRSGSNAAGTTTFNGASGGRIHGGVMASSVTIAEVLP